MKNDECYDDPVFSSQSAQRRTLDGVEIPPQCVELLDTYLEQMNTRCAARGLPPLTMGRLAGSIIGWYLLKVEDDIRDGLPGYPGGPGRP